MNTITFSFPHGLHPGDVIRLDDGRRLQVTSVEGRTVTVRRLSLVPALLAALLWLVLFFILAN